MRDNRRDFGLVALVASVTILMGGCNRKDACNTASSASRNIQMLGQSLVAAKKDPTYFHRKICPWFEKSEKPYLQQLATSAMKLSKKIGPRLCVVCGPHWQKETRAMFSAQGIGEELSALSDTLTQACAADGVRDYFFEDALVKVNFSIPQYYAPLSEFGGCRAPAETQAPNVAEGDAGSKRLLPDGAPTARVGAVETADRKLQQPIQ